MSENMIALYLKSKGVDFVREHVFLTGRRFRFDFAIPEKMVAVEYEGATWSKGRHTRGKGYSQDCFKYSWAAIRGWCVIRVTADMVADGKAWDLIDAALDIGETHT